jgi:hypothetical protein
MQLAAGLVSLTQPAAHAEARWGSRGGEDGVEEHLLGVLLMNIKTRAKSKAEDAGVPFLMEHAPELLDSKEVTELKKLKRFIEWSKANCGPGELPKAGKGVHQRRVDYLKNLRRYGVILVLGDGPTDGDTSL